MKKSVGFATNSPLAQSHAAILLKGLGIPSVCGVENLYSTISNGDEVIVDTINGFVIARPTNETKKYYEHLKSDTEKISAFEKRRRPIPAETKNGIKISLMANIENPNQVPLVLQNQLNGIGLFRTEFMVLQSGSIPREEEQYTIYRGIVESMGKKPIVIRTFDIGADKSAATSHRCTGMNPALGVRGIKRHILHAPEELSTQLRAIMRAATGASVSILFPMITDLNDIKIAKEAFFSAKKNLTEKHIQFSKDVRIGAMIEVPSAAILTAEILREVDFISIGTNDLLQYFMGADRNNPEVISYSDPKNSAFQWLLKFISSEVQKLERPDDVTICGEIASCIDIIPILLGSGFRTFSISPVAAERVRKAISGMFIV